MPLEDLERIPANYSVEIKNGGGYWIVSLYKNGSFIVKCLSHSLQEALHIIIAFLDGENG
jgi:hypothetical protein